MPDAPAGDALRAARKNLLWARCPNPECGTFVVRDEDVAALEAAARAEGAAEAEKLRERLLAANGLLRSAYQIVKREERVPNSTNWGGFALRLSEELALEHEITGPMYAARSPSSGTEAP